MLQLYYAWEIWDGLGEYWAGRRKEEEEKEDRIYWEMEVERVMKQKNQTSEGTVNRKISRKATDNQ